ncbi:MAG: sigma 54-interacting transcriptional regulator [Polyangiaceae bacterium]|jgi:two-component system nitrogen regulation response regulator GlnG/two-component system response regulator HydG|nr:sigma 54-interacting transcriptional regulator [Polyangiaceae bacterium]
MAAWRDKLGDLAREMADETRDKTGTNPGWLGAKQGTAAPSLHPALHIAWSLDEPGRIGECAVLPPGSRVLGRGGERPEDPAPRLLFARRRPGPSGPPSPLTARGVSRVQLLIEARGGSLQVENVGRAGLLLNGRPIRSGAARPGDTLSIEGQLVLLVDVASPLPGIQGRAAPGFPPNTPDPHGIVGESELVWKLRDEIAFASRRSLHVLVLGPSGAGKELVARAIHALSPRASGPFVARSAATLPAGLMDAELFGNAKNYPHAGLAERPGLVGEAHGGTLFLDEIGELPQELQAHLLRLLDGGEYHRLGEGQARRADLRLVAATNRPPSELKHDLLARLTLRLSAPGLDERRSDIPALLRHLILRQQRRDPGLVEPILDPATGEPRIDPELIEALLRYPFTTHARELEAIALVALARSRHGFLAMTDEILEKLVDPRRDPPSPDEIREALAREGSVTRAFRALGLPSRDALNRLLKKHGIRARE